jgi:hypothetical protein
METKGFYKNDDGMILYAPNFVDAGSFLLLAENKDSYTYPIGGWYWFDSEEDAYLFWNLQLPIRQENSVIPPPFIPD